MRNTPITEGLAGTADEASQLYGPTWAPAMAALQAALRDVAPHIADHLYERLNMLAGVGQLLEALAPEERQRLKTHQAHNLLTLADPGLTPEQHLAMARIVGRTHCIIGLARVNLLYSHDILHAEIQRRIDPSVHGQALSVLTRRLIRDLAWQTESYQSLQASRYEVLLRITRLVWDVDNYTDLILGASEILSQHDEITACAFGRPDDRGVIRFESIEGLASIKAFLAELESNAIGPAITDDRPEGHGPTGRAWRTARIEHCLNIATDPQIPQAWKKSAKEAGFTSSVAIPLCQPGRRPLSMLTLYNTLPGGYSGIDQVSFIAQIQTLLVFALTRIEHQEGPTNMVPYSQRRHWSALLRSDALEMHYQPLLELKTGRIAKIEALARLRDGDRVLPPGEFFPALSSDDFVELYARGLRQALQQRNDWLARGLDMHMSINLPSSGLADMRYFNATRQALGELGCTPSMLTLELLESEEIPPDVDVAGELAKFKALGVNLAEDDLGSGYSSLNRLRELPFDAIKIDRSIVTMAGQDGSNVLRFIYQLTRLGHSLGKLVIVEGVENTDLLEAITILGADIVQGYVIARPMPAEDLTTWMQSSTLPDPPDPRQPRSVLAKLARLLIWEERLHLLQENTSAMAPDLPFESIYPNAQQALATAATRYGLRSPQYAQAREQLVAALTSGA